MPNQTPPAARRPAGRPRADSPPVLHREELLAAAARAFGQGYAAMSVRALARELGVSQATVQHHTGTKADLFDVVVDEVVAPRLAATRQRSLELLTSPGAATTGDPTEALRTLVRARLAALAEFGGLLGAVLADTGPDADARRRRLLDTLLPERRQGLDVLRALSDQGVTRPLSPTTWTVLVAFAIPAIARSWTLLEHFGDATTTDLGAVLDELADLLVLGLVPR